MSMFDDDKKENLFLEHSQMCTKLYQYLDYSILFVGYGII